MLTASVDSRQFNAFVRDLARIAGAPLKEALRHQAAAVLKKAIDYSPSVKLASATLSAQNKIRRKFNTYAGGRAGSKDQYIAGQVFESAKESNPRISISNGKTWWRQDGTYYVMKGPGRWEGKGHSRVARDGGKWSNERWAQFQAEEADRQADLAAALAAAKANIAKSRGLGKHSWLQAADELGITHLMRGVPAYVRKAVPANGKRYINGRGQEGKSADAFFIKLLNSAPMLVGPKGQGAAILQRAMNARVSAFNTELRKGVFSDVKLRAQRYPGLFVS